MFCFVIQLNSTKRGQITNVKVVFHMVVSIYKLDKIWNSTQSPAQPQSGQLRVVFELNTKTRHQNEKKIRSSTSWSFKGYKEQLEKIFSGSSLQPLKL